VREKEEGEGKGGGGVRRAREEMSQEGECGGRRVNGGIARMSGGNVQYNKEDWSAVQYHTCSTTQGRGDKSPRNDSKSSSALSMRSAYSPIIQIMLALAWGE
jgi:hypothetical protein